MHSVHGGSERRSVAVPCCTAAQVHTSARAVLPYGGLCTAGSGAPPPFLPEVGPSGLLKRAPPCLAPLTPSKPIPGGVALVVWRLVLGASATCLLCYSALFSGCARVWASAASAPVLFPTALGSPLHRPVPLCVAILFPARPAATPPPPGEGGGIYGARGCRG